MLYKRLSDESSHSYYSTHRKSETTIYFFYIYDIKIIQKRRIKSIRFQIIESNCNHFVIRTM